MEKYILIDHQDMWIVILKTFYNLIAIVLAQYV